MYVFSVDKIKHYISELKWFSYLKFKVCLQNIRQYILLNEITGFQYALDQVVSVC